MDKNHIVAKGVLNVLMYHKGVEEPSRIFCDEIEYLPGKEKVANGISYHHLVFWHNNNVVFKAWLNPKKDFNNIYEALGYIGIKVFDIA